MSNKDKLTKKPLNLSDYEKELLKEIEELKNKIKQLEYELDLKYVHPY